LQAFQNQVHAQVAPLAPTLAEQFIQATQEVIDILSAGTGKPHGKVAALLGQASGKTQLQFAAAPGAIYIVEAFTNLVEWEAVGVAADLGDGTFEFEDPNSASLPARFYRIAVP
jgi:hypothetical protein